MCVTSVPNRFGVRVQCDLLRYVAIRGPKFAGGVFTGIQQPRWSPIYAITREVREGIRCQCDVPSGGNDRSEAKASAEKYAIGYYAAESGETVPTDSWIWWGFYRGSFLQFGPVET